MRAMQKASRWARSLRLPIGEAVLEDSASNASGLLAYLGSGRWQMSRWQIRGALVGRSRFLPLNISTRSQRHLPSWRGRRVADRMDCYHALGSDQLVGRGDIDEQSPANDRR